MVASMVKILQWLSRSLQILSKTQLVSGASTKGRGARGTMKRQSVEGRVLPRKGRDADAAGGGVHLIYLPNDCLMEDRMAC